MQSKATTPQQYFDELPEDRKGPMEALRATILKNLPEGFEEVISYGMVGYVVPHSTYPNGYHVNPKLPLPFINIASQKNFIAVYHMGVYADTEVMEWFTNEFPNHSKFKLDMGKNCIRFKKVDHLPYELLGELTTKFSVQEWIDLYEKNVPEKK